MIYQYRDIFIQVRSIQGTRQRTLAIYTAYPVLGVVSILAITADLNQLPMLLQPSRNMSAAEAKATEIALHQSLDLFDYFNDFFNGQILTSYPLVKEALSPKRSVA